MSKKKEEKAVKEKEVKKGKKEVKKIEKKDTKKVNFETIWNRPLRFNCKFP